MNRIWLKDNINKDFEAWHHVDTAWIMKDFHFHDAFEIYLAMSDGIQYFIEDSVYYASKGDLFVFSNMDLHKTVVPAGSVYERYIATFMPEYIEAMSTERTDLLECFLDRPSHFFYQLHLTLEQQTELTALFEKAIRYRIESDTYGSDIYSKLILIEMLILVNSFYRNAGIQDIKKPDREYKRIKQVLQYVHRNLSSDLSLDTLAGKFYISKYHLGFIFKNVTGFTINEYIISRRVMKARELLKRNLPVSQVGEMVGYNNDSHFIRTFKKMVGITPKQYAKKG